jgi:hypothetical protein
MSDLWVSPDVRVVANERGELILLHTRTGRWFLLNGPGAALWRTLAAKRPVDEAATALAKRHPSMDVDRVRAHLQRLLSELTHAGLVTSRPMSGDSAGSPSMVPMAPPAGSERPMGIADRLTGAGGMILALVLVRLPFGLCLRLMLTVKKRTPRAASYDEAMVAVLATQRISRFFPGRVACLELSLAATVACAMRGRQLDWCLGTSTDPLRFHAWVEAGGRTVIHPSDEPADRSYRVALRA